MKKEDVKLAKRRLEEEAGKAEERRLDKARSRGRDVDENSEHPFADEYTKSGVRYYKSQTDPRSTDEGYKPWHARVVFAVIPYPARGLNKVDDQESICRAIAAAIRRKYPQRAVVASYKDLEVNGRKIPVAAVAVTAKNPMRLSAIQTSLKGVGSGDTRITVGSMESLPRFVATGDPEDGPFVYGDFKPAGRRGRPVKKKPGSSAGGGLDE